MLLSDGFGGFGGISKFNSDFLSALGECDVVDRVHALPRVISEVMDEAIPEAVVYDREAALGKIAFMQRLAVHAGLRDHVDLVICGHFNLLSAAWLYARVCGARLALIIHGIEAWNQPRLPLTKLLARHVNAFIAVSRHTAERFTSWSRLSMDRAFILPNCVDLERFVPKDRDLTLVNRYGLESNKVIMTVGRLASQERYKGFDEVIEVMPRLLKRFPTLKYLIVGDGPDRPRLEAKTKALGVADRVVYTGRIPESEKVAHYNLADAYVMPSFGEGFGIVLIEAAACGIPVIGSRADGSREALLNGRLGRLVDPRNPDELVQMVASVLEDDRHGRIDRIETFSVNNFRTRVATWVHGQAIASARVTATAR
jgi:phosphatidylinositol alpha-1,6-mannosyltransferase